MLDSSVLLQQFRNMRKHVIPSVLLISAGLVGWSLANKKTDAKSDVSPNSTPSTSPAASPAPGRASSKVAASLTTEPTPHPSLIESNDQLPVSPTVRANFNKWLLKAIKEDATISCSYAQWQKSGRKGHTLFAFDRWKQEWEKARENSYFDETHKALLEGIVSLARNPRTICTQEMAEARIIKYEEHKKQHSGILQSDKSLSSFFSNPNNTGYIWLGFLMITLGLGTGIPALLGQFSNNKNNTGDDCVGLPYEPGRPVPNPGPDRPDQEMMFDSADSSASEDFFLNTDVGIAVSTITMVLLFAAFMFYTHQEHSSAPSKMLRNSEGCGDLDSARESISRSTPTCSRG